MLEKTRFSSRTSYIFSVEFKMSEEQLSARDLSILNLIFDPTQLKTEDFKQPVIDESDAKDKDEGSSECILLSKRLELEGVNLTEEGKLDEALVKLVEAISIAPQRPSPHNNRAQLYRFLEKDDCNE